MKNLFFIALECLIAAFQHKKQNIENYLHIDLQYYLLHCLFAQLKRVRCNLQWGSKAWSSAKPTFSALIFYPIDSIWSVNQTIHHLKKIFPNWIDSPFGQKEAHSCSTSKSRPSKIHSHKILSKEYFSLLKLPKSKLEA